MLSLLLFVRNRTQTNQNRSSSAMLNTHWKGSDGPPRLSPLRTLLPNSAFISACGGCLLTGLLFYPSSVAWVFLPHWLQGDFSSCVIARAHGAQAVDVSGSDILRLAGKAGFHHHMRCCSSSSTASLEVSPSGLSFPICSYARANHFLHREAKCVMFGITTQRHTQNSSHLPRTNWSLG